jgi:hypothetical protein
MRKILCLLFPLLLLYANLYARQPQENRRIEEDKRGSLISTESALPKRETQSLPASSKPLEIRYLSKLQEKDAATLDDATLTIALLLGSKDNFNDFKKRLIYLEERGIVAKSTAISSSPDSPLTRGQAGHMFCKALKLRGGIFARIFGLSQRYALNELAYEGIMDTGYANSIMSGSDLVSLFINSADYLLRQGDK